MTRSSGRWRDLRKPRECSRSKVFQSGLARKMSRFLCISNIRYGPHAGSIRLHRRLAPPYAAAVDLMNRRIDPLLRSVVQHGLPASRRDTEIVDNRKASGRELWMQMLQRQVGGFVQIAVQPDQRKRAALQRWQSVAEQTLDEHDLIVQQAVAIEIGLDGIERHRQFRMPVQSIAAIGRVQFGLRRRHALEGIRDIDLARAHAVGGQDAAQEDTAAAAPHAGFYEVAGYIVIESRLREITQVMQPVDANHGVGRRWTQRARRALAAIELVAGTPRTRHGVAVDAVDNAANEEIDVKIARRRFQGMTPSIYADDLKGKMPQRLRLSNRLRWAHIACGAVLRRCARTVTRRCAA